MKTVTADDVMQVLKRMAAPDGRGSLAASGLISDVIVENANDALFVLDPDGVIVDVNRRASESLGIPREALVGRTWFTIPANRSMPNASRPPPTIPNRRR